MKRILAILLALVMVFALGACGCNSGNEGSEENNNSTEAPAADDSIAGTYDITVWAAEKAVDLTKQQIQKFNETNEFGVTFNATVEPVSEADAGTNMVTDVEAGGDLYCFAQDQFARLVQAGALAKLGVGAAETVKSANDAGVVKAATAGEDLYAYPMTADNGYFLYYDKSVVTDPSSLDKILEDCAAAGKDFYMEINSGWYQPAFFFGAGCTLTYDTDDEGAFTNCNIDYASDKGVGALKAMVKLAQSSSFKNGSSVSNATNAAAIVDGTWDSGAAKELFGDNYACAKLPMFDLNGTPTQLGGFGGFKLLGVKPQTDEAKLALCDELALFLSSGDVQLARYNAVGWGPSNIAAKADPAVQADEALAALGDQLSYTIPQGQYPGDYWGLATSLGDSVISGEYNGADDSALLAALQAFQDTCIGYAG